MEKHRIVQLYLKDLKLWGERTNNIINAFLPNLANHFDWSKKTGRRTGRHSTATNLLAA
ncbi:MAG: hypothetical protein JSW28_01540 [Thermoplasmata archaeon]|nr:MAG: hypothetical protein JSW28_01540 [Thermoplasmata archaeon]